MSAQFVCIMLLVAGSWGGSDSQDPLYNAIKKHDLARVHQLIYSGADVNLRRTNGWTPLHYASTAGWAQGAQLLIAAGAQVQIKDRQDRIPLHLAGQAGFVEVAEVLLRYDSEINTLDWGGQSPLQRYDDRTYFNNT